MPVAPEASPARDSRPRRKFKSAQTVGPEMAAVSHFLRRSVSGADGLFGSGGRRTLCFRFNFERRPPPPRITTLRQNLG